MEKRNLVLYIATSLDGYIATKKHNLDWLLTVDGEGDNGYSKFYATIDTILIGRVTYEWIMDHENGNFPYKDKECYVFSKSRQTDTEHVRFIQSDIVDFVNHLKSQDGKDIWLVGGGNLLHTFIKEKMVDEVIINIAPVLIGSGIPLFENNDFQTNLILKSINRYNQFVELSYKVIR